MALSFSEALYFLKIGRRVRRTAFAGYIYLDAAAKVFVRNTGASIDYFPVEAILSDDWIVVEDESEKKASEPSIPSLSKDLYESSVIKEWVKDYHGAMGLYSALCNVVWQHKSGVIWDCTWRAAATIVADIRNKDEDYLEFYSRGWEGIVKPNVRELLANLGWTQKVTK